MSLALDLGICTTSKAIPRVKEASDALQAFIAGAFTTGSGGDIALQARAFDGTATVDANLPSAVSSDMLHGALEAVTGRQREKTKVTHIGILLAGEYQPRPDFFGLMFDEAFVPGSSDPGELTPREGCAVFLSAIDRKRKGADFIEEVLFTGTHELGHVFNQQHSAPSSFMAVSADRPTPFSVSTCGFNPHEESLLGQCSSSRFIWPGGSAFGDLGDLAASPGSGADSANAPSGLKLTVATDRDAFWPFEPVELDVVLSYSGKRRSCTVPDFIDPGYEAFTIWIEEPSGARRRYRSPRHYCEHSGRLRIARDMPFRRDISIFGESGAYTFRRVGLHRVWAQFRIAPGRVLQSNVVELDVRVPGRRDAYAAARQAFSSRDAAQLLYYRRLTSDRAAALSTMEGAMQAFPREPINVMAHYAMGRSLERLVASLDSSVPKDLATEAKRHLRRAATSMVLGDHRRGHAEQALDRLSSRGRG